MKRIILVFSLASIMMGCSTAYRSGQTPDDVYFSPVREASGYVNVDDDRSYRESNVPLNDRYLRMKSMGGSRWRSFDDDFAYWNNPYWNNSAFFDFYPSFRGGMGMGMGMGMGFSPFMGNPFLGPTYFGSGLYYNPFSPYYFGNPVIVFNNVKYINPRANGPRIVNLNNYTPPQNYGPKFGNNSSRFGGSYINNGGSGTPRGGYNPRGNGGNSSPSRTFGNNGSGSGSGFNNSSNSSSSGSSGSSSAPVRSFGRGGN